MFEIGLTRIFSATIWYHFAFVAISVALLGWGLGGFALHLLKKKVAFSLERAACLTLLYAIAIPVCLWLIVRLPFHPDRLAFYFLASLQPFLLAGMALSMVFDLHRAEAGGPRAPLSRARAGGAARLLPPARPPPPPPPPPPRRRGAPRAAPAPPPRGGGGGGGGARPPPGGRGGGGERAPPRLGAVQV